MTGYTERTISLKNVMECLIKVQTFFELICGKKSAGWMDKIYKIYLWSVVYQHKKQPLGNVSTYCRCSLPSWLLVGMGLHARCNCNKHYYFSDLLQVHRAQMVGYCNNKCECWSGASVSDMHAYMHMFTDMTVC